MTAPWNTDAPLGTYLRRARQAGITRTVVFPVFQSDYSVGNRDVARLLAKLPGRLTGFAMVHADRDSGQIRGMVRKAVLEYGFRGIKVHGLDGMPTREVCEAAYEFNLPLLVDVVGKAHVVDMFAPQYPAVNFIVAHMGSFNDDWRAHQRVIEQLVRYRNVCADTSGVRRFDYILQAVKRAGAQKLLFGSDGPWLHPGVELYKIRMLKLPVECEKLILGGNAARLILRSNVGYPWATSIRFWHRHVCPKGRTFPEILLLATGIEWTATLRLGHSICGREARADGSESMALVSGLGYDGSPADLERFLCRYQLGWAPRILPGPALRMLSRSAREQRTNLVAILRATSME